jgi:hypothetical protein
MKLCCMEFSVGTVKMSTLRIMPEVCTTRAVGMQAVRGSDESSAIVSAAAEFPKGPRVLCYNHHPRACYEQTRTRMGSGLVICM